MQLGWLTSFFENSPAIGLLRSKHAPFLLDFFSAEFKGEGAVSRPMQELTESLRTYLQRLHETQPEVLTDTAENYLADWCSAKKRYLRRFLVAECDEPLYELTSSTEDVLTFLNQLAHRDTRFVGTESRLKRIIETLGDLALGSSDDVPHRLEHLRQERTALDEQIATIEAGGGIETYNATARRDNFPATKRAGKYSAKPWMPRRVSRAKTKGSASMSSHA